MTNSVHNPEDDIKLVSPAMTTGEFDPEGQVNAPVADEEAVVPEDPSMDSDLSEKSSVVAATKTKNKKPFILAGLGALGATLLTGGIMLGMHNSSSDNENSEKPVDIPNNEQSVSSTAVPAPQSSANTSPDATPDPKVSVSPETTIPAQELSLKELRSVENMEQYYALDIEDRVRLNWSVYKQSSVDASYSWVLRVPVDPNREVSGYYDWSPIYPENTPSIENSGKDILHQMIYSWAMSRGITEKPYTDGSLGDRDLDRITTQQMLGGLVYDPLQGPGKAFIDNEIESFDATDWKAFKTDWTTLEVVDEIRLDENGDQLVSEEGYPMVYIAVNNTATDSNIPAWYTMGLVEFMAEDGTQQNLWVQLGTDRFN